MPLEHGSSSESRRTDGDETDFFRQKLDAALECLNDADYDNWPSVIKRDIGEKITRDGKTYLVVECRKYGREFMIKGEIVKAKTTKLDAACELASGLARGDATRYNAKIAGEGRGARSRGVPRTKNPHQSGSDEAWSWFNGWDQEDVIQNK